MPNGFSFISHTIDQKSIYFAGFTSNYDQVLIEFTIQRRSSYFLRLISWPGSILVLLTLVIFFLPPTASERILYGRFDHLSFFSNVLFSIVFQVESYSFVNSFFSRFLLSVFPNNSVHDGHGWLEQFSTISVWQAWCWYFLALSECLPKVNTIPPNDHQWKFVMWVATMTIKRKFILSLFEVYFWLSIEINWSSTIVLCNIDVYSRKVCQRKISLWWMLFLPPCVSLVIMIPMIQQQMNRWWNRWLQFRMAQQHRIH